MSNPAAASDDWKVRQLSALRANIATRIQRNKMQCFFAKTSAERLASLDEDIRAYVAHGKPASALEGLHASARVVILTDELQFIAEADMAHVSCDAPDELRQQRWLPFPYSEEVLAEFAPRYVQALIARHEECVARHK